MVCSVSSAGPLKMSLLQTVWNPIRLSVSDCQQPDAVDDLGRQHFYMHCFVAGEFLAELYSLKRQSSLKLFVLQYHTL